MKTLGKTKRKIDLEIFIASICSNYEELEKKVTKFLTENHEWKSASEDAANLYYDDMNVLKKTSSQSATAKELGVSEDVVYLANKISIQIFFGFSHYLHQADYNIYNPVNFAEISAKLGFARMSIVKLGFKLAEKYNGNKIIKKNELSILQFGFGIGATLGYLTDREH